MQVVYDDLMDLAVQNKFNSLEKPKNITLISEPWTVEDGMLTPTQKLKRNIAKERLAADIKRMYSAPIMKPTGGKSSTKVSDEKKQ